MRKKLVRTLILCAVVLALAGCVAAWAEPVRVASLKGPTTMGLVQMIDENDGSYDFTIAGTADEIVPLLVRGELDIALVPCNLASVLYNKTEGAVNVAAVNTLGVLYVIENGDTVHSLADLQGKTLASTGKGTTPEYALNAVLSKAGVALDVNFMSEATEVASALTSGQVDLAMLPQPYVTAVMAQNPNLRIALSLTDAWKDVMPESALVTGVVLMRGEFIKNKPTSVSSFLEDYRASTQYVNENPAEAAKTIEELGVAKAAVAEKAIPYCNIVCVEGDEMKAMIGGYLTALYAQDPTAVGGKLPGDDFYLPAA